MNIPLLAAFMQRLYRPSRIHAAHPAIPTAPATSSTVEAAAPPTSADSTRRVRELVNGKWAPEIRLSNGRWVGITPLHTFEPGDSGYYMYVLRHTKQEAEAVFKDWDARNGMGKS